MQHHNGYRQTADVPVNGNEEDVRVWRAVFMTALEQPAIAAALTAGPDAGRRIGRDNKCNDENMDRIFAMTAWAEPVGSPAGTRHAWAQMDTHENGKAHIMTMRAFDCLLTSSEMDFFYCMMNFALFLRTWEYKFLHLSKDISCRKHSASDSTSA